MKLLGSKQIETERLILHKTEEKDLKELWEILCLVEIHKYYLTTKIHFNWEEEKKWQYKKLEKSTSLDVFCWTIERKDTKETIGQISVQEGLNPKKKEIRDIGWFIAPEHQKKGFCYEAAMEVLKYMFLEVGIDSIRTSAAINNPNSWHLMERLGFKRLKKTHYVKYTFIEEPVEVYEYECRKNNFLKEYFRKQELYITEDIDKDPYIKHISDDLILNITGESGSGKSTAVKQYDEDSNCIVIDTDELYKKSKNKKYQELTTYLIQKYNELPNLYEEFDKVYSSILEFYKNSNKTIIIDSAQYRNLKDITLLKGDIIIIRTCINTCYNRCIERYQKNHPNASFLELASYSTRKKNMYIWYHLLNNFIERVDNLKQEE